MVGQAEGGDHNVVLDFDPDEEQRIERAIFKQFLRGVRGDGTWPGFPIAWTIPKVL